MPVPYRMLPLKLLPKTILIPLVFLFCAGLGGAPNLQQAFQDHYFLQAETWWIPWVMVALFNAGILAFLHPAFVLAACADSPPANVKHRAHKAMKHFSKLGAFSIALSIGLLFAGDAMTAMRQGEQNALAGFEALKVMVNLGSGFFLGVLVHFSLENSLFLTKKLVRDIAPDAPLPYQSLYFKIFLVLTASTVLLVVQAVSMLPSFIMIERPETAPLVTSDHDTDGALQWMKKNGEVLFNAAKWGAKDVLDVFFLQVVVYLAFIVVMLGQVRALIRKPLAIVEGTLADLNRGRPEDVCTIDVVQNDEFASVFREINHLIDSQQSALNASQQRLSHIVAGAADPIVVFDDKGAIRLFNPAAESFFGYTEAEAKALNFSQVIDLPEDVACACETTALPLIHYLVEETSTLARHSGLHKNGTKIPFESNISTTKTPEGQLFTAVLRDISGQLAIEENLTKAKLTAENSNRMKSEFLANMSHELRTPLNAVLGFTQLMSADKNLTDGQLNKIEIISRSGEHLLALINDILDISKIEAGKFEMHSAVFDLEAFVNDLRDMFLLKTQKKGLHLDVEVLDGLPRFVRGDLGKLRQVMINLVGNAVKFTNEGGIGIVVGPDNGSIRFSVNDSGKGIPAAELDLIMQPFTQSSNTDHEGGTGLGLTISHRFIELMGGKLEVESRVDVGSTFAFALPLTATEAAPGAPELELKAVAVKQGREVSALIVDDKETNRLILKEMLERVGFTTVEAENGQEAVERTREFKPQIVFMDIKMPVLDGYGAVAQIKADASIAAIPVFALTASAFKHDEEHILAAGFDGFLAKPFKQSSLFRLIHDKTEVELEYEIPAAASTERDPEPEAAAVVARRLGSAGLSALEEMALINDFTGLKNYAETLRGDLPGFAAVLVRQASGFDEAAIASLLSSIHSVKETA